MDLNNVFKGINQVLISRFELKKSKKKGNLFDHLLTPWGEVIKYI
jgi:hypothetical protein